MTRAFLVVLDSVGIGGAPDAAEFFNGEIPDSGANTLGHIADWCAANRPEGPLHLPVMTQLGLGAALRLASGHDGLPTPDAAEGRWGVATEISRGKDTSSGHWELSGLPVPFAWHYFAETTDSFPPDILASVQAAAGTDGVLGRCHASGTEIIARLGEEHQRTGWPICYTSIDSVFQIAAHEETFGLDRLLMLCRDVAPMLHARKVGRVIARPFVGDPGSYTRTGNRRDFAVPPPAPVLTDWVQRAGGRVYAIGKIGDIFAMQGIDEVRIGDDATLLQHLEDLVRDASPGSLTFANFVEFDSLCGHRRDPAGYAAHLEWFDAALGDLLTHLGSDDMLVLTADHGNDPTWPGTDHTRERVPVLIARQGAGPLGHIGFADVAGLIAAHLGIDPPT